MAVEPRVERKGQVVGQNVARERNEVRTIDGLLRCSSGGDCRRRFLVYAPG
jgi:hypothetical protein